MESRPVYVYRGQIIDIKLHGDTASWKYEDTNTSAKYSNTVKLGEGVDLFQVGVLIMLNAAEFLEDHKYQNNKE